MKLLFENWRKYINLLNEEQLLIEGRIQDAKKKYPWLTKKGLLDILIEKDPSGNQKYLIPAALILDKEISERRSGGAKDVGKLENLPIMTQQDNEFSSEGIAMKVANQIEKYHLYSKYLEGANAEFKDLQKVPNLDTLNAVVRYGESRKKEKDEEKAKKEQQKQEAIQNSEIIMKDDNFLLVRPLTTGASCYWGMGTKWCISATQSENYFNSITAEGKGFYFLFMKNKKNFWTSSYRQYHKLALVYGDHGEFEEAYDAADNSMDNEEVTEIIAMNLLGEDFVDAYKLAINYTEYIQRYEKDRDVQTPHLEDDFREEYPEQQAEILATLDKLGLEPDDDLEEVWDNEVLDIWNTIDTEAQHHFEMNPAGPSEEEYQRIEDEAGLQHVYIHRDYDENEYWSGGFGFDFGDLDFGPKFQPEDLEDFDLEDEMRSLLDAYYIYPDYLEVYQNEVRIDINPDEYESVGIEGFRNFVDSMSKIDSEYDNIREDLIKLFIEEGALDISDEPIGQLKAKLAEKEFKHFVVSAEGRRVEISVQFVYENITIFDEAAKEIIELMGLEHLAKSGTEDTGEWNPDWIDRVMEHYKDIQRKIVYFFKIKLISRADDLLYDKLDALMVRAYAEAEKQLQIPGIEAPEIKRMLPATAFTFNPYMTSASLKEKKIKTQMSVEVTGELDETQSAVIAEFVEYFDENYDILSEAVKEAIDELLNKAVVKTLESKKEELPERARALGLDENKKRKKGIKILLGRRQ